MTIIYFIISLGVLIFIHEFGHFIVAKRNGIKVEAFSLGFGPRLIGFKKGGTDYRISLLPLGGYVKMLGESPDDEHAKDPDSFSAKSVWSRIKVVAFGPIMNLILCIFLMPLVFMLGRAEPVYLKEKPVVIDVKVESPASTAGLEKGDVVVSVDGKKVSTWEDVLTGVLLSSGKKMKFGIDRKGAGFEKEIQVGELPEIKGGYIGIEPMFFLGGKAKIDGVRSGGPADKSGLKSGDIVVSFAGEPVRDWYDLASRVNTVGGVKSQIVIERGGETEALSVTPLYDKEFSRWLIGITQDRRSNVPMTVKRYGPIDAVRMGMKENVKLLGMTLNVLKKLVTLDLSVKVLGGPIIIAKISAAAAASGLSDFIYFLAFLSLQLAVLNLLPVPVLDGGHLFFMGIEAIRKKPVSMKVRMIADQVGFVLLISLMLFVTYNDVNNIWGIKAIFKKLF